MIQSSDIVNRAVTGTAAAKVAGIPRGTMTRLRSEGVLRDGPISMADTLSLHAANSLVELGLPATKAAGIGRLVGPDDWQRVIAESEERRFHLVVRTGEAGDVVAAVVPDAELAGCRPVAAFVVDLTAVGEAVFARLLTLQKAAVP